MSGAQECRSGDRGRTVCQRVRVAGQVRRLGICLDPLSFSASSFVFEGFMPEVMPWIVGQIEDQMAAFEPKMVSRLKLRIAMLSNAYR